MADEKPPAPEDKQKGYTINLKAKRSYILAAGVAIFLVHELASITNGSDQLSGKG